jgi:hypothetical protein
VQRSTDNRYLIAHAVATRVPMIRNDGSVPLDLVLLAQRALEKDLTRRLATISWEDFLGSHRRRQNEVILGLRSGRRPTQDPAKSRVPDWVRSLEEALDKRLMEGGIHCKHKSKIISNQKAILELSWPLKNTVLPDGAEILVQIEMREADMMLVVNGSGELRLKDGKMTVAATPIASLPVQEQDQYLSTLLHQSYDAFIRISADLVTKFSEANHEPTLAS